MINRTSIGVRHVVAAAGLLCSVGALAHASTPGEMSPASTTRGAKNPPLEQAATLLANGKAVRAKALLLSLTSENAVGLSDAERREASQLLNTAAARVRSLPAAEIGVQSAEVAFDANDLLGAERHARSVIDAPNATNAQANRAREVMTRIDAARKEMGESAPKMIADASELVRNGRIAGGRAMLQRVASSGVKLAQNDQVALEAAQFEVLRADEAGLILGAKTATAGMLDNEQPGVVRRRDEEQPATPPQPANEQPAAPAPESAAPAPAPSPDQLAAQARRLDAEATMREAEQAFNENRWNDSIVLFQRALSQFRSDLSTTEVQTAQSRINESRIRMGSRGAGQGIIEETSREREWRRQAAIAEFNNLLSQSRLAAESGDFEGARNFAASASLRLSQARNDFSVSEYETFMQRHSSQVAENQQLSIAAMRITNDEQTRRQLDAERNRAGIQEADRNRRINEAISRVRALQSEMKYAEALQVVDQILFLDPINPTGLVLRDVLQDAIIYRGAIASQREAGLTVATLSAENREALRAPLGLMNFPTDWPGISNRRGSPLAFVESEENRRVLASLEAKRIPVNFKDNSFADVVNFVQTVTQLNVDTDWQSLEEVGVQREKPITLSLTNVPVKVVLDRVMERASDDPTNGAAWAIQDGVLQIASKKQIDRAKAMQVYDIRDLLIDVPNYTNAPEFDLQAVLQERGRGGGGGQSPFRDGGQNNQNQDQRTLEERTDELIRIITTQVDTNGWQENGGETGFIQRFQGNLIITNTPNNHRAIHGLLSRLREVRAMQINVETRFLLVSQDWFEQIGVDIDVYFNGKNNQVRTARVGRPTTRPSDFFDFSKGGIQETFPQTGTGAGGTRTPLPSPLSAVGAGQNSLGLAQGLVGGEFGQGIIGAAPALGIAGQFLDDIQVDFLIKATQADRRTTTLTAPRLTFTNGQTSNIIVATQTAFVSDLQPVVSDSAVGFDPDLGVVTEGVRLLVEGTVSADRRYVTMNVQTAVSKLEGFGTASITAVAGGQLVNSEDAQSQIQLPITTVTRVETTVTVPDQGTILMGGQRLVTEQQLESGVPVLSKLPIINRLFTNRIDIKEEQMLLILMKPTIIIQNEEEERSFPGLAESIRTGFGG